jgi:hypothetical protein
MNKDEKKDAMTDAKTGKRSPASALDALVREAKQDLAPRNLDVDDAKWSAVEERILARMAQERSPLIDEVRASTSSRVRFLRVGAAVLAAAAAIALVVKNDPATVSPESAAMQAELGASSLRSNEGPGEVRVGGFPVSAGHALRAGDLVEADGTRAVLERPRKVTWLLEASTPTTPTAPSASVGRARVKSAGESLVLGLEDGAIEAQVTPVPNGEAFAVDVASGTSLVRVAVHGTHLRVARVGSHVTVDLTEGVVSIGVPPRSGSTYGTLVTAPAHVELDVADLDHSLRVDHGASAVRAAITLAPSHESPITAQNNAGAHAEGAQPPAAGAAAPVAPATVPRPASVPRPANDPSRNGPPAKVDPTRPVLPPRAAIAEAVRECAAQRSRPQNVRVTVTSSLTLHIATGGDVETAQFDPPLLPEIQSCAATAIYKAKLAEPAGTSVVIPIDFSY